jgi:hypothetical protein
MQIQVVNDFNTDGPFTQAQQASFLQDEQTAVNILDSTFTNNISVTIDVGYGSFRGQVLNNQSFSVGDANTNAGAQFQLTYTQLRNDLLAFGQPGFFNAANLPAGNSINGVSNFWISSSVGACFGLFTNLTDGFVGIGTNFTPGAQRVSAFLHELGHALGRVPENNGIFSSELDLWRFTSQGNRLFDGTTNPSVQNPVQAAYFSLDGGATDLADWGQTSDPSDFRGPGSNPPSNLTPNDPFDEFVGNLGQLTTRDIQCMEALGFTTATTPVANPAPPPGTTADMVLRHGADGLYEIYDIGGNSLLAAYQLGQVGTDWRFVTLAGFFGNDTTDMLLRNANTGGFEVYDVSNNNITNAAFMGTVGLDWQVMGFGNFSSRGETDMILRNANNGGVEVYDLSNNQITGAAFMGTVGLNWQFSGIGNFSGRGTSDMLIPAAWRSTTSTAMRSPAPPSSAPSGSIGSSPALGISAASPANPICCCATAGPAGWKSTTSTTTNSPALPSSARLVWIGSSRASPRSTPPVPPISCCATSTPAHSRSTTSPTIN